MGIKRTYPRDHMSAAERLRRFDPQSRFHVGRVWRIVGLIVVVVMFAIGLGVTA